jgi:hypothetical protein
MIKPLNKQQFQKILEFLWGLSVLINNRL